MINRFKKMIFIFACITIAALAGIFWYHFSFHRSPQGNEIKTISIGNAKFQAEVVSRRQKMELGLGGRENLCSTCGMVFVFPKAGIYSFWMKDMKFPLDIVWLSKNTIVHVETNVQPGLVGIMTPTENADRVLELNAGVADKFILRVGDMILVE